MPRRNENIDAGAKPKLKAKRKGGRPSKPKGLPGDLEPPTSLVQRRRGSGRGGRGR